VFPKLASNAFWIESWAALSAQMNSISIFFTGVTFSVKHFIFSSANSFAIIAYCLIAFSNYNWRFSLSGVFSNSTLNFSISLNYSVSVTGFIAGSSEFKIGVTILAIVDEITWPISYPFAQGFFSSGSSITGGGHPSGNLTNWPFSSYEKYTFSPVGSLFAS